MTTVTQDRAAHRAFTNCSKTVSPPAEMVDVTDW